MSFFLIDSLTLKEKLAIEKMIKNKIQNNIESIIIITRFSLFMQ